MSLKYKYIDPKYNITRGFSASRHIHALDFFKQGEIKNWWAINEKAKAEVVSIETKTIPIKSLHSTSVSASKEKTDVVTSLMSSIETSKLSKTGKTRIYIIIGIIALIVIYFETKLFRHTIKL